MANKKSNEESRNKSWVKYVIIGAIVVLFVPVFALVGYQKYLDKADAERFATLQSDFKKLQTEFNKIDPGWEYGEGCTAGGKLDDHKTCFVALSNDNIQDSNSLGGVLEKYHMMFPAYTTKIEQQPYTNDDNLPAVNMQIEGRGVHKGILCDLSVAENRSTKDASVYCRDSARNFYFDRTDR